MDINTDKRLFAFEDLLVWQKSIDFAEYVITTIDQFDAPRKHYRIIEQLEAAAISVSSNIAEGKGRFSKKEFIHYLYIARGSLFETISLLILICRLKWIAIKTLTELKSIGEEIAKMLNSLIKSIKSNK
ncbi:MAG: four helix bundle protein [Deltaproteobacteria bacterium]|nr:four helix bundle protein [Deltaproteobacteria bacterium]